MTVRHHFAAVAFPIILLVGAAANAQEPPGVSALGFVEPEGGVIQVSGPTTADGSAVAELHVKEGDKVDEGQIIAVMDNHPRYLAALVKAEARIKVHEAALAQVLAGAREGRVAAQEATIRRINGELRFAQSECQRVTDLFEKNVTTRVEVDEKCKEQDVKRLQVAEARATLEDIIDVRPVDVAISEAELAEAEAAAVQAEIDLERTIIRSPVDGQVLRTHAGAGERIGQDGVVDLGQTDRMWIRAEIYETDIIRVSLGQVATVTSDGFAGELTGTVQEIGLIVGQNRITETDPTADVDARVIEVKIKLDEASSAVVSRLTNLQVSVVIDTSGV